MRRDAREGAFKLIFETLFKDAERETLNEVIAPLKKEADIKFCEDIFKAYEEHRAELEKEVSSHLQNYDVSRVYRIDLALIYLALTEIKYLSTPKAVAMNEAIEISKKYSTSDSKRFINGILSAILG